LHLWLSSTQPQQRCQDRQKKRCRRVHHWAAMWALGSWSCRQRNKGNQQGNASEHELEQGDTWRIAKITDGHTNKSHHTTKVNEQCVFARSLCGDKPSDGDDKRQCPHKRKLWVGFWAQPPCRLTDVAARDRHGNLAKQNAHPTCWRQHSPRATSDNGVHCSKGSEQCRQIAHKYGS